MDAVNQPVRRRRGEMHTADLPVGQMDSIDLDAEQTQRVVVADERALVKDYADALAMGEDPITIIINQNTERNAPLTMECWVQGKGAEMFINGRWVEVGWLPVNNQLITKRKYAEVCIRSKVTSFQSVVGQPGDAHIRNELVPTTNLRNQVSVLEDANPKGREWFIRLMQERI